ncbi:MAG: ABC transporter permease [Ruminococcus sp.]|nr:ABC transporter permease [Ruminococcus sp.]
MWEIERRKKGKIDEIEGRKSRKYGKRKSRRRWIFTGIFLLLNLWFLGQLRRLQEYEGVLSLSYPKGSITDSAFSQWKKSVGSENIREAVLWKSKGRQEVLAESTGHGCTVDGYQIRGQAGILFGRELAAGRYFTEGEKDVCLLDQETVRQLYGSEQVQGLKIRMGEHTWEIIGILKGAQEVCVIPAEKGAGFDGIAVRKKETGQSSLLTESQIRTILGGTDGQLVDGKVYVVSASIFYGIVMGIAFLMAGLSGKARNKRNTENTENVENTKNTEEKVFWWFCMAAAGAILAVSFFLAAPGSDYLPSYWSDFGFFGRLFQEKAEQIQALSLHQEFASWHKMLRLWRQMICAGIFLGISTGIYGIIIVIGLCQKKSGRFLK